MGEVDGAKGKVVVKSCNLPIISHNFLQDVVFLILFTIIIPNLDLAQPSQVAEVKLFQPLKGTQCM